LDEIKHIWAMLGEYVGTIVARAQNLPIDQLRLISALACLAFLLVLVAWIGTSRKLRRIREALAEAQAQSEALQAKYDAEVKWRKASESPDRNS